MATDVQVVGPAEIHEDLAKANITIPGSDTKIYKDECTYCHKSTFYPGGLYVCLQSYCSFCKEHLRKYAENSGATVFVHIESSKVAIQSTEPSRTGEPIPKISKLAIGSEGGFNADKVELVDQYHITVYPNERFAAISPELGEDIYRAAHHVETCTSAERLELLQSASNAWDGEIKLITKHIDLPQLDNGKTVPTSGWKCEQFECDLTENLWLNLADGAILCGRSQLLGDGKTSVGSNHMRQHYENTGFPLVVKLGTISADETADVYSYDEDDAVVDSNLRKHLAHWGLDMDKLKKTEKSTLEMELDMNQKWEWAKCVEDGAALENKYGPGYTGLINIGSSCYINSVVQALLLLPSFQHRFVENAAKEFNRIPLADIHTDFNAQVTKLLHSMMTGEHALKEFEEKNLNGIKPKQFKTVIAGNHHEFRTAQQQDAEEYLRYLIERITNATPDDTDDVTLPMKFKLENRFEDKASGQVRYTDKEEVVLSIPVREDLLTPLHPKEGETELRFTVALEHLLDAAFSPCHIDSFKSPITGEDKGASNTLRFKTFPEFLILQIQKFTYTDNNRPKKFDMDLIVQDTLDVSNLKSTGKKDEEVLLPDNVETSTDSTLPDYDKNVATQLQQMGFSENASIKAAIEVRNTNGTAEHAMEWLLPRLDDPSINDPIQPVGQGTSVKAAAQRACVQELVGFGFTAHQACYALDKFQDVNQAAEWLFEHAGEVPAEQPTPPSTAPNSSRSVEYPDGNGMYKLIGFISHMGSSTHSGHYVAHLQKDEQWILYNDEKVAVSQNPPRQLGYLYIFQRI